MATKLEEAVAAAVTRRRERGVSGDVEAVGDSLEAVEITDESSGKAGNAGVRCVRTVSLLFLFVATSYSQDFSGTFPSVISRCRLNLTESDQHRPGSLTN